MAERLRVGSLFSGMEGFGMGLEAAGFKVAWQVEIDKDAVSVLERHYPNVRRYRDVREVNGAELENVDAIAFGSPCQGFSVAGRGEGLNDERSGLFGEAIRIIREKRPEWVIWENVPGVLSSNDGRDFIAVLEAFETLGYAVEGDILDAQFHGVPQRRRRVFLVCHDVSGPPKRTPYYANIGLQALGENLVSVWDEAVRQSSIAPTSSDIERLKWGARGRQRRMRLFGITTSSVFKKWLAVLGEGCRLSPTGLPDSVCHFADDQDIGPTEMGTYGSLLARATDEYAGAWSTAWSWSELWGDLSGGLSESTTSTPTKLTTDQRICSSALALLSIAPFTLHLMRSSPSWFDKASWSFIAIERLTRYARQATDNLFVESLGGSLFWGTVEQCATNWHEQAQRYLGASRTSPAEILSFFEGMCRHPQTSDEARQGSAGVSEEGAGSRGVAAALRTGGYGHGTGSERGDGTDNLIVGACDIADTLSVGANQTTGFVGDVVAHVPDVAYTLAASNRHTGDGHGNAWNTTYVPMSGESVAHALTAHGGSHGRIDAESETFIVAAPLTAGGHPNSNMPGRHREDDENLVAAFHGAQITSTANRARREPGLPAPTLNGDSRASIAVHPCLSAATGGPASPDWQAHAAVVTHALTTRSGATEDGTGRGTPRAASHDGMSVRRLMPVECERLMGWPKVSETVTIHVWNETHHDDKSRGSAVAEMRCTTVQNSALTAEGSGSLESAPSAEAPFCTSHPGRESRAALSVSVNLEWGMAEITASLSGCPSSATNAVSRVLLSDLPSVGVRGLETFAHLSALIASILGRTTPTGKGASPRYMTPSTHQQSGSRCVVVSGREIEERADDAVTASRMAKELLTSTTSEAGQSSQGSDSILTTLCCSVMRAIAGSIPEPIRSEPSYDVSLTISSGWTQFRADGSEIADGPRYRMIGNGVVSNVSAWVGRRLRAVMEATA